VLNEFPKCYLLAPLPDVLEHGNGRNVRNGESYMCDSSEFRGLKKEAISRASVTHTCNPSYSGGRD
jgi:hypothetical protein